MLFAIEVYAHLVIVSVLCYARATTHKEISQIIGPLSDILETGEWSIKVKQKNMADRR